MRILQRVRFQFGLATGPRDADARQSETNILVLVEVHPGTAATRKMVERTWMNSMSTVGEKNDLFVLIYWVYETFQWLYWLLSKEVVNHQQTAGITRCQNEARLEYDGTYN